MSAVLSLGELRATEALGQLLSMLTNGTANERGAAAVALGQIGEREAVPALIAQATDEAAAVRGAVAWALGALGDTRARETLEHLRADADPDTAEAAREALGKKRAG